MWKDWVLGKVLVVHAMGYSKLTVGVARKQI